VSAVEVHFGGPDLAPGTLRDLLAARAAAVPAGGRIDWITYYFRDRRLADELLRAHARGVRVRVTLEGHPRTPHANDRVRDRLAAALGRDLRVARGPLDRFGWSKRWRPRLHEKLYCFSHPTPIALLGSFNPSGDEPEDDPATLAEIGDQDRGHNLLVELRDPTLARALTAHAERVHRASHLALERWLPSQNRALESDGLALHFRPRSGPDPVLGLLARTGRGARIRVAASHLSGRTAPDALLEAARRGAEVEVLAEWTERRVPARVERALAEGGVRIERLREPGGLPMHLKLLLVESDAARHAAFGSFNWTENSLRWNREIIAISRDTALFERLAARYATLRRRSAAAPQPG
jgi:phosphatidylserine/phosphatidylglycerophosphate/cardiolipin synthase-like enzyme